MEGGAIVLEVVRVTSRNRIGHVDTSNAEANGTAESGMPTITSL